MKLRVGKKLLVYDFESETWEKAKIVHIDQREGTISFNINGRTGYADITELDDPECYKEK